MFTYKWWLYILTLVIYHYNRAKLLQKETKCYVCALSYLWREGGMKGGGGRERDRERGNITRWREDMNFTFKWPDNILKKSTARE